MGEDFELFGFFSIQVSMELVNMLFVTSCIVLKSNFSRSDLWWSDICNTSILGYLRLSKQLHGSGVLKKTEISGFSLMKDIAFGTCRWMTHQQSESHKNLIKLESESRQSSSCVQNRPATWRNLKHSQGWQAYTFNTQITQGKLLNDKKCHSCGSAFLDSVKPLTDIFSLSFDIFLLSFHVEMYWL